MGGDHSDAPGLLPGVSNKKKPVDQNVVGAFALNSPKEPGLFKYEPIPAAELARAEALPPPPPPTHPPPPSRYRRARSARRPAPATSRSGAGHCYRLLGCIRTKDYGIRGADARAARLARGNGCLDVLEASAPYAEFELGTHSSAPCTLDDGTLLSRVEGELPWLLKVLSIRNCTPCGAHPDLQSAESLHVKDSSTYPDTNHKPKLMIALTPFEALVGFRRRAELAELLARTPELAACVKPEAQLLLHTCTDANEREAVRSVFESWMRCADVVAQTQKLVERLRSEHQASKASGPAWLKKSQRAVLQLAESHPHQMGAMLPLLLNYLLVAPGEAFYVAPCEPHAYVAGECVEVCASSNNFVRIGLSPNIDVEAAITLLSYETGGPDVEFGRLQYQGPGTHTLRYAPDVADFEARVTTVEPGGCFELESFPVPSILLVVAGSGETGVLAHGARSPPRRHRYALVPGTALYVTEGTLHLAVSVPSSNSGPLRLVRCCENLDGVLQTVAEETRT